MKISSDRAYSIKEYSHKKYKIISINSDLKKFPFKLNLYQTSKSDKMQNMKDNYGIQNLIF